MVEVATVTLPRERKGGIKPLIKLFKRKLKPSNNEKILLIQNLQQQFKP